MKTSIHYRKLVREELAKVAGFALTEDMLADALKTRVPKGLFDLSAMREAVEWNLAEAYVKSRINEDIEEREWIITPAGMAKEDLA